MNRFVPRVFLVLKEHFPVTYQSEMNLECPGTSSVTTFQ
jgi:hypothetical protein